jgi:hypothetical protein
MPVIVRSRRHPLAAALAAVPCAVIVACSMPQVAAAQNAQANAAQLSALFTTIRAGSSDVAGAGVEAQQRFNRLYATESFGAVSLGLGGQYTVHTKVQDRLSILGLFIEPRWVPATGSSIVFPYLSARFAIQRMTGEFQFADGGSSIGTAVGAGAGVAVKLTRRINLDAGAQFIRQQFGDVGVLTLGARSTYTAKIGLSIGYPR